MQEENKIYDSRLKILDLRSEEKTGVPLKSKTVTYLETTCMYMEQYVYYNQES